ncbi:DNA replication and repair protein RecF [Antricoccus suffuscus]|uniref:DNA replication and repair protein RecF n=1 Tax=Antricoccus suffuscus TaxID=1629062 RepID=A0A2T1A256_9ACTN|nr:DNA replication/repair protein RecF [Antricoccus suffuscus]PRZ42689.1 DNA replication and repair protein RecF [Antricoccus suffuscus]
MYISRLHVLDFRNYVEAQLDFARGPNVLIGANGQGKTNLVEAVGYLGSLSSHRVASDLPLIRRGAERAVVRGAVVNDDRELLIEVEITAGKANRARVNRSPVSRTRDVIGISRSVLFAPEDLELVRGDPGVRRKFLDDLLTVRYPRYASVRSDYDKVLRQRNALLKTAGMARRAGGAGDLRTIDVWDGHLVRAAAALLHGRLTLVRDLSPFYEEAYANISGAADTVGMTYRASGDDGADSTATPAQGTAAADGAVPAVDQIAARLAERLAAARPKEVERGVTLVGPHRDELLLTLDDFPAKGYASHGQSWSIALAMRLASYELLRAEGNEPILILDDVFAELDTRRRNHLARVAIGAEQTLITAAVESDVPDELGARSYYVDAGTVVQTTAD